MLENVPLFAGLTREALAEVEQHGSVKSFRKGAIVRRKWSSAALLLV